MADDMPPGGKRGVPGAGAAAILAAAAVVLAVVAFAVARGGSDAAAWGGQGWREAKARRGRFEVVCVEEGTIRPVRQTVVASRETGRIAWICPDGQRVAGGDKLVELESEEQQEELKRLKESLAEAERAAADAEQALAMATRRLDAELKAEEDRAAVARLKEAETLAGPTDLERADAEAVFRAADLKLKAAQEEVARMGPLVSQGYAKESDLRRAEIQMRIAECEAAKAGIAIGKIRRGVAGSARSRAEIARLKADTALELKRLDRDLELWSLQWSLKSSRSNVERLKERVGKTEEAIERRVIRAPHDGIAVRCEPHRRGRKIEVGDQVWSNMPVIEIPDMSRVKVRTQIPEKYARFVSEGATEARVRLKAAPDTGYRGVVVWMDRWARDRNASLSPADRKSQGPSGMRVFDMDVEIRDGDISRLRLGFRVVCEIVARVLEDVVIVPREAVRDAPGGPAVAVVSGSGVRLTAVKLGPESGGEVAVIGGLAGGETILVPEAPRAGIHRLTTHRD
ncbi:MAG: HlyD family efflux transporter periplasmic adaptor subunit [Planctomycetota bacterium]|nr:HlyD family efflux transporter periplasmic adaptor subunit [Planctomycetota bacterium]